VTGYEHETDQDVRHMLGQLFSVARRRHWAFILPAAFGVLAALGYTFTYPRVYKAKTMFERRDSMVLASLIRSYQYNPYSFPKMRQSIYVEPTAPSTFRTSLTREISLPCTCRTRNRMWRRRW